MVTAIVLINVDRPKLREVTDSILNTEGVTEVYPVAGEYDLVAIVRVGDTHTLSQIVVDNMPHNIPGITHTKTLFAFDAKCKKDLAKLFDVK